LIKKIKHKDECGGSLYFTHILHHPVNSRLNSDIADIETKI